jgi:hypothetical protein
MDGDDDAADDSGPTNTRVDVDDDLTSGNNPDVFDDAPSLTPRVLVLDYEPGSFCSGAVQLEGVSSSGTWSMSATTGPSTASTGRADGGSFVLVSGPAWLVMRGDAPPSPVCGDGRIDAPEQCEPSNLSGMTCADFGLSGTALGCSVACVFDTSGCVDAPPPGCECASGASVRARCSDFGFDAGGDTIPLSCGDDCRVDLGPCGFPPVLNPVAADTFACGTSGGIPLCWGQNDSDILTLPRMPLLGGGADSFSAGDGFNAGIFNDTLLHHHAVAPLLDAFGAALPTGTAPAAAVRSSANLLCTGTDSGGGGGMDVSCYAVDSPSPPMPLSTGIADFALSDQTMCAIFQGSAEVACAPFLGQPYAFPIYAAAATDGTQKMVVDGSTVCLVHPNAPSLQSGTTGNVACWNALSGSSVFSSIRDAVVSDLVSAKSSGLLCATLAEPFQSITFGTLTPAGEVFCWENTGTSLDERGPVIDPGTGAGFDADRLALSGDYLCAQDRNLGTRCVSRTADPSSHEGQGLAPDDRFAHVAIDPNPGITAGCAVRADGSQAGTITCWGANRPFDIPNDSDFVQVAVSAAYVCGLTNGGEVRCASGVSPAGANYTALVAGPALLSYGTMCGLRDDGSLRCWDAADTAQVTEAGPFVKVSVGEGFACAIDLNDTPQCFGFVNGNGVPLHADQLPSATARDVSLGLGSACVIDTDQRIQCWGATAALVPVADAQGPFIQVTTSIDSVCAVEDPTGPKGAAASVVCWGAAASVVQGMRKSVQSLSIGDAGVCALRRNGYLACWGASALGYR